MDDLVASFEWLAERLGESPDAADGRLRVVDVREPWEFEGIGHVPGAVNVPFERFRDDGDDDRGRMPGADAFAALLGKSGIEPADTVVAYDDTFGVFAARFLVTARHHGHADVRLLEGDYSAWSRSYGTSTEAQDPAATTYEVGSSPAESPLVDRAAVESALAGDGVLVDTRERDEYAAGHLPGAVRFDWRSVVDEDGRRLKPREEIERILAERGITREREVVLYCNTARRISHTYVVLRWLGYDDVGFYEGSLEEWVAGGGVVDRAPVDEDADAVATDTDAT